MDSNIKKWLDTVLAERADLEKQMAEVKAKYPLVALAYYVQKAILADTMLDAVTTLGQPPLSQETVTRIQEEFRDRKRKRERCLGNAKTKADALQCLKDYPVI